MGAHRIEADVVLTHEDAVMTGSYDGTAGAGLVMTGPLLTLVPRGSAPRS